MGLTVKGNHFVLDVLDLADEKCSGSRECGIEVPDPDFSLVNVCDEELKVYLAVSYTCLKVKSWW